MENERQKYFKDVINKCSSDVRWKKKEALEKCKNKNVVKKNSRISSRDGEDENANNSFKEVVTIAEIHQDQDILTRKQKDRVTEKSSLTSQLSEDIIIELEEIKDNDNNDSKDNQYSGDILADTNLEFTKTIQITESKNTSHKIDQEKESELEDCPEFQECPKIDSCCTDQLEIENNTLHTCNEQENAETELERTQSDELQATITDVIPDEQMELIRKSLDEENHEIPLSVAENKSDTESKKKKRQERLTNLKKNYADFLSEDEDFVWDSTSWKDTDEESTSSEKVLKKKTKKSKNDKGSVDGKIGDKGLKKKKENKRLKAKECRQKGKSYVKKDGTIVPDKKIQANPCIGMKCGHNCGEVSEEKRLCLFNFFWNLSASKRKDWLVSMSKKVALKRKRVKDSGYRTNSFEYYINDGEGRRQVCLKFILKTLNISQKYVYYTLSNACYGLSKEDERGRTIPANKTSLTTRESVIKYIKNLPALPSHYCRKETTRLYLPVEYKNLKNVYRIYKEDRISQSLDVVSESVFRDIFNKEFNIGFHVPKKDKCLKCLRFESNPNDFSDEKQEHLEEKLASKNRLNFHRELGKDNPSILSASFDLQKVLNTPHGNSILLFYTRKYAVYNLCFYENVTREGYCYLWGESDAKRGGNEVATILEQYIYTVDMRGTVKHLILYSDSCPGQNKNRIVMAAVHNALSKSKTLESIQLNYLLPGHTEMSVDSMHSAIENSIRNTIVWAPTQWLTICQVARKEVSPYHVQWLTYTDFKNYEEISDKYFKGNLTGKISKIRIATFKKSALDKVFIKYSMKDGSPEEAIPVNPKQKVVVPKPLYKALLPITKSKYNDLKKLCETGVIPKIFHREYLTLPSGNGKDVLIDTDIEDSEAEEEIQ